MGSRNPERDMMKNLADFEAYVKIIDATLKSPKTKLKKLEEWKDKLEGLYLGLNQTFHIYKADIIAKESKTEEAFNSKDQDTGEYNFKYNDAWSDSKFAKFIELTESIEDKIDELEKVTIQTEEAKPDETEEKVDHIETELKSEKSSLGQSIEAFINEVNVVEKIPLTAASSMEKFSDKLKVRMEVLVLKSRKEKILETK